MGIQIRLAAIPHLPVAVSVAVVARGNRTRTTHTSDGSVRNRTGMAARAAIIHVRARVDLTAVCEDAVTVHVADVAGNPTRATCTPVRIRTRTRSIRWSRTNIPAPTTMIHVDIRIDLAAIRDIGVAVRVPAVAVDAARAAHARTISIRRSRTDVRA
ncbi:MAG: hypothetical protein V1723_01995 [Candidatus Uhrbacteria bacterium]